MKVPEVEVEEVGGRVDGADGAVELEGVFLEPCGKALAEDHLEGIARPRCTP